MKSNRTGNVHTPAANSQMPQNTESASGVTRSGTSNPPNARAALANWLAQDDAEAAATETRQPEAGDTDSMPTEASPPNGVEDQTEAAPAAESDPDVETPEAEAAENSEDEAETDLSQTESETADETEVSASDPKGVAKRIGKLKAQHAAELAQVTAELAAIRNELQTVKQSGAAAAEAPAGEYVPPANAFAAVNDPQKLERIKSDFTDLIDWAEENPDGGSYKGQELNHEQVKTVRRNARRYLAVDIPARERWLAQHQVAHQAIVQDLPTLADAKSADYTEAQLVLQAMPWLKSRADYEYWAAAMARGHKTLQAEIAARKSPKQPSMKPTVKSNPPPAPRAPAAVPPKADNKAMKVQAARDQALKSGTRDDLANYLTALR